MALELDSIEPVQEMSAATNPNPVTVLRNSDYSARYKHPSSGNVTADTEAVSASTISIADFLPLVNIRFRQIEPRSHDIDKILVNDKILYLNPKKRTDT